MRTDFLKNPILLPSEYSESYAKELTERIQKNVDAVSDFSLLDRQMQEDTAVIAANEKTVTDYQKTVNEKFANPVSAMGFSNLSGDENRNRVLQIEKLGDYREIHTIEKHQEIVAEDYARLEKWNKKFSFAIATYARVERVPEEVLKEIAELADIPADWIKSDLEYTQREKLSFGNLVNRIKKRRPDYEADPRSASRGCLINGITSDYGAACRICVILHEKLGIEAKVISKNLLQDADISKEKDMIGEKMKRVVWNLLFYPLMMIMLTVMLCGNIRIAIFEGDPLLPSVGGVFVGVAIGLLLFIEMFVLRKLISSYVAQIVWAVILEVVKLIVLLVMNCSPYIQGWFAVVAAFVPASVVNLVLYRIFLNREYDKLYKKFYDEELPNFTVTSFNDTYDVWYKDMNSMMQVFLSYYELPGKADEAFKRWEQILPAQHRNETSVQYIIEKMKQGARYVEAINMLETDQANAKMRERIELENKKRNAALKEEARRQSNYLEQIEASSRRAANDIYRITH